MISAASHQVIFFAIAFNSTSCSFIIRSISAAEYCLGASTHPASPPLGSSGQIMCELDRTGSKNPSHSCPGYRWKWSTFYAIAELSEVP